MDIIPASNDGFTCEKNVLRFVNSEIFGDAHAPLKCINIFKPNMGVLQ